MAAAAHTDDAWKRLTRTVDLTGVERRRQAARCAPSSAVGHRAGLRPRRSSRPTPPAPTTGPRSPRRAAPPAPPCPPSARPGSSSTGHPCAQALPDRSARTAARATGHQRRLEQLHRRLQRLAAGLLRPERATRARRSRSRSRYITDPGTGGRGVFVDDAAARRRRHRRRRRRASRRRSAPGASPGRPRAAPAVTAGLGARRGAVPDVRQRSPRDDTVLLGFGLEHVAAAADRQALARQGARRAEALIDPS